MSIVPNIFPRISAPYRIALVGEAPGKDEVEQGIPFIGRSGRLLNDLLSKHNIVRDACYIGNVCQVQPPGNVLAEFDWMGEEIQSGLKKLYQELITFKPHLIVCLGNTPLHAIKVGNVDVKKKKVQGELRFSFPNSIDSWRGSLFIGTIPGLNHSKVLATFHPAFCLRAWENTELLSCDLRKASREGRFPELFLSRRNLYVNATFQEVLQTMQIARDFRYPIALDIEGYYTGMSCISIAGNDQSSTIIPFFLKDGSSCWSLEEEVELTRNLALLLSDPYVPKVWQNGLYDRWVLQYGFSMPVYGNKDDTMLKWWEKYCELEKNLGMQTSVLTDEPYYKGDRKSQDDATFFTYCCKDSAVTYEINQKLEGMLSPASQTHYKFNHALLNLFLYIELRGILFNKELVKVRRKEVEAKLSELQCELDVLCGYGIPNDWESTEIELEARSICCFKKDATKPKKEFEETWGEILDACYKNKRGFLSGILGLSLNTKGAKFKEYIYETLALPVQKNKDTGAVTTDSLALLKLLKKEKVSDHAQKVLSLAIEIGFLRTRAQQLGMDYDNDSRVRTSYNLVGTVTGRITSSKSQTGSGGNLQTMPDKDKSRPKDHPLHYGMRDLFIADPGHWFFNCDLKGSDGWTIGAHLARLGDNTMLEDLKFGIKPAARICYMIRKGIHVFKGRGREEIREMLKEVKGDDWDYFALKVGIWGMCYLMGPDLLADVIFEESDGKVLLSRKEVHEFKDAVFAGYSIKLWHDWMARQLAKKPELTSASGNTRRFFGHPREILGEALSTEPQNNTTYATNLAAYKLWMDPENRIEDGSHVVYSPNGGIVTVPFKVEPLHQVHDSLNGQFRFEDTAWATAKIKSWFNNPLKIAGYDIVIPFEGKYGPSWGQLDVGTI